jgi:Glu-tRNA(Gln) amidotransferase subunit E-like FAD-binding protein
MVDRRFKNFDLVDPQTPEEIEEDQLRIRRICEEIHEDRRKAEEAGRRMYGLRPLPDSFRMPPVYRCTVPRNGKALQ